MTQTPKRFVLSLLFLMGLFLCGSVAARGAQVLSTTEGTPASQPAAPKAAEKAAPAATTADEHIQVQHILIGFQGSVPGKNITRTQEEAKKLANEVLARAKKGEDFDALVKEYTNDSAPGIYGMSNMGVTPAQGEFARGKMVKGFGDVSFSVKPGEIGMADYDPTTSPYGWHIVKRLK